jgi:hypothetical protein
VIGDKVKNGCNVEEYTINERNVAWEAVAGGWREERKEGRKNNAMLRGWVPGVLAMGIPDLLAS